MEVNVSRWQEHADAIPISTDGGQLPRWSKDAPVLYFLDSSNTRLMRTEVLDEETMTFSAPELAFALPEDVVVTQRVAYDTLPGGGFVFAVVKRGFRHHLVFNWLDEVDSLLGDAGR